MVRKATGVFTIILLTVVICLSARAFAEPIRKETIVLAGGCFWGIEAVFEHTKGVLDAESGYAGGNASTANYEQVSQGASGHAEAVQVTYDPSQISLSTLLDVFFIVAHNPTQLNFQGPDRGTQYRSAVFVQTPEQKNLVGEKIAELTKSNRIDAPIVTTIEPLTQFFKAESYHQNYAAENSYQPYIVMHDAPKIAALEKTFPDLFEKKLP